MCGILGFAAFEAHPPVDRDAFTVVLERLAHRGPDGRGVLHKENFSFGHTRLSILDLSARGTQPMSDTEADLHVTYNGEIFNHWELRRELLRRGHRFETSCDTEVLLHAYAEWGVRCLEKLDGMFAFGLFDGRKKKFLLARDRLGIKPLYWARLDGGIVFASELDALVSYPGVSRQLDPKGVSALLSFRHTVTPRTCFAGVQQLLPGHQLVLGPSSEPHIEPWWDLPMGGMSRVGGSRLREELAESIATSVGRALVADVPVAAFLSGGLDSSIVLREMVLKEGAAEVQTFTAAFDDPGLDESPHAVEVARCFGARNTLVKIDPGSLLNDLRKLIRIKGHPLGMHNEVCVYLLAQVAARTHKVVLSGEGADELFGGYGRIFRLPFEHTRRRAMALLPTLVDDDSLAGGSILKNLFDRYPYFPMTEKQRLFREEMRIAADGDREVLETLRKTYEDGALDTPYAGIRRLFIKHHLPGLLQMMDSMCMASGLEARVPFVDHRLVELSSQLPANLSLRWRSPLAFLRALGEPVEKFSEKRDYTKYVLRRIYAEKLPAAVLGRRKNGFAVPLSDWLTSSHGETVRGLLLDPEARLGGLFDQSALENWLRFSSSTDVGFGKKLWLLINLELWLQEYFPNGAYFTA